MNRRNFALSAVALTAMALVPFTACKKDGGGASGSSADMLSYMPTDTSVVISISAKQATGSALFKKYQKKIMENAGSDLADFKEKCAIDAMTDVHNIVIGFASMQKPDDAVVAVKGNFDKKKAEECVTKMGGKVDGSTITSPDGDTMNVVWAASDTLVFSKGRTAEQLQAAGKGANVKSNKELSELIGKADSSATIWVAGMIPAELAGNMPPMMGTPPKAGFLSLTVDSGVSAKVGMIFASDDEAKAMATVVEMGLSMGKQQEGMKEILDGVKAEPSGKVLTIKAKATGDQVAKLEALAGGMF